MNQNEKELNKLLAFRTKQAKANFFKKHGAKVDVRKLTEPQRKEFLDNYYWNFQK